jgi:peptidoglycan/LPS O-acetylase OafA/YrhL
MTRRVPSLDTPRAIAVSWVVLRHLRGVHLIPELPGLRSVAEGTHGR